MSIRDDDVEFIDRYAKDHNVATRSGVLHKAISLLRESELSDAYAAAWEEWDASGEAALWETTTADGLEDENWSDLNDAAQSGEAAD